MELGRNKTGDLQGVVENLFWLAHVKEHVRIIGQYRKIGSRPRKSILKFSIHYQYITVDAKFYAESEYDVEISIPPTQ